MHGHLAHFAINADDVPAARRFYEALFGWRFAEAYGPGFIRTHDAGPIGVIQARRELLAGVRTTGVECTFAVDDIGAAVSGGEAHGGRVVLPPSVIPGAGELFFFADPDGNVAGAMRYDAS